MAQLMKGLELFRCKDWGVRIPRRVTEVSSRKILGAFKLPPNGPISLPNLLDLANITCPQVNKITIERSRVTFPSENENENARIQRVQFPWGLKSLTAIFFNIIDYSIPFVDLSRVLKYQCKGVRMLIINSYTLVLPSPDEAEKLIRCRIPRIPQSDVVLIALMMKMVPTIEMVEFREWTLDLPKDETTETKNRQVNIPSINESTEATALEVLEAFALGDSVAFPDLLRLANIFCPALETLKVEGCECSIPAEQLGEMLPPETDSEETGREDRVGDHGPLSLKDLVLSTVSDPISFTGLLQVLTVQCSQLSNLYISKCEVTVPEGRPVTEQILTHDQLKKVTLNSLTQFVNLGDILILLNRLCPHLKELNISNLVLSVYISTDAPHKKILNI